MHIILQYLRTLGGGILLVEALPFSIVGCFSIFTTEEDRTILFSLLAPPLEFSLNVCRLLAAQLALFFIYSGCESRVALLKYTLCPSLLTQVTASLEKRSSVLSWKITWQSRLLNQKKWALLVLYNLVTHTVMAFSGVSLNLCFSFSMICSLFRPFSQSSFLLRSYFKQYEIILNFFASFYGTTEA